MKIRWKWLLIYSPVLQISGSDFPKLVRNQNKKRSAMHCSGHPISPATNKTLCRILPEHGTAVFCRRCCNRIIPAKSHPLQHKIKKDFKKLLIEINRKPFSDPWFPSLTSNTAENKHLYCKITSKGKWGGSVTEKYISVGKFTGWVSTSQYFP